MNNRRYQRIVVDKEVPCQLDNVRDFVFLYDLSVGGCMIETSNPGAQVGSAIKIDLAGMTEIEGKIVWRIDNNAGVAFDWTVAESVVEYLGFEPSILSFTEVSPRDRYGISLTAGR